MKSDEVMAVIRQAIREGVLTPGEELVQEDIAGRLGVSRPPLREALRSLAAVGIVQILPGRGFRVTQLEVSEVLELYRLRLQLEPDMAPAILDSASAHQVEELRRLDQVMRESSDQEAWAAANYEFHISMYGVTSMKHTLRIIKQLLDLVEPYSRMYVHEFRNVDRADQEHSGMLQAIASQDVDRLRNTIRAHLEGARDCLAEQMGAAKKQESSINRLESLRVIPSLE